MKQLDFDDIQSQKFWVKESNLKEIETVFQNSYFKAFTIIDNVIINILMLIGKNLNVVSNKYKVLNKCFVLQLNIQNITTLSQTDVLKWIFARSIWERILKMFLIMREVKKLISDIVNKSFLRMKHGLIFDEAISKSWKKKRKV